MVISMKLTSGRTLKLALGLAGAVALAGVSATTASAQNKEIAVMLPAAGDPYFKLKACGYTEAGKEAGYDVKIYDAGGYGNLNRQVSQIQDVIQRKVSGIVLVPASSGWHRTSRRTSDRRRNSGDQRRHCNPQQSGIRVRW